MFRSSLLGAKESTNAIPTKLRGVFVEIEKRILKFVCPNYKIWIYKRLRITKIEVKTYH